MPFVPAGTPPFEDVTETTGIPVTHEGARMMYTRYAVAADLCAGRRALELACGGGNGLGLLGARAGFLVGGDYSGPLIRAARSHYRDRFPLVRLSAERLPFRASAFDVVLFFEATYYVPDMEAAFEEVARVLAPAGTVMFVNANPERPDFIPSPHSTHYHSAAEFRQALQRHGFNVAVTGAFPVVAPNSGWGSRVASLGLSALRRILQWLGLVPKTLKGRARLKSLLHGKMIAVPAELIDGFTPVAQRMELGPGPATGFKVLYVSGTRRKD